MAIILLFFLVSLEERRDLPRVAKRVALVLEEATKLVIQSPASLTSQASQQAECPLNPVGSFQMIEKASVSASFWGQIMDPYPPY